MTAAATRKLTKDIENVLKKVNEGIEEFDEYWEQAVSASSGPQKEKLGEELKKSINKLQRLRAQIREWIGQAGVPNGLKDKLEDARRKIESDMQRFKEFERELKTKAFSSSALVRRADNEEAEKAKYQDWLGQQIQTLQDQLDLFEADIEALEKKKSLGNDEKSRLAQLKELQERHRWHIRKLEQLLRAVDNDAVEVSDLAVVRDSIEIYVESCEEPDCYHDETLYDGFDLTEFEEKTAPPRTPTADASKECSTPASSKEEPQRRNKDKEKRRKEEKKEKKKEEKKGGTTANPAGSPVVSKASVVRNPPAEVKTMLEAAGTAVKKTDSRERLDTDEVKVQEDQLLGEAEEFICKICQIHVVGCGPKLTSCSHLFCGDCIAQWFAQHPESQTWAQRAKAAGPERVVPCPVCKQPLNEKRDLYPVCGVTSRSENLLLWRMLSSLKIMCCNHPKVRPSDGKCDWIGEYGSYQKHAERCKNLPVAESGFVESENTTPAQTPQLKPSPQAPPVTVAPLPANAAVPPQRAPAAASPKQAPAVAPAPAPMASSPAAVGAAQGAIGAAPSPAPASPAPAAAPAVPARSQAQPVPKAVAPKAAAPTVSAAQAVAAAAALSAPRAATPAAATTAPAAPAPSTSSAASEKPAAVGAAPRRAATEEQGQPQQAQPQQRRQEQTPAQASTSTSDSSFVAPAMSAFEPSGSNMVPVQAGDLIQVLEQHGSGWTYAKNLSLVGNSAAGWIPSWIVQAPSSSPEAAQKTKAAEPAASQQSKESSSAAKPVAEATTSPAPAKTGSTAVPASQQAQPAPAVQQESPSSEAGKNIVRATAPFSATSASQLTLLVSDQVEIVERHSSGWTYGRKASEAAGGAAAEGWFPDWAVATQK